MSSREEQRVWASRRLVQRARDAIAATLERIQRAKRAGSAADERFDKWQRNESGLIERINYRSGAKIPQSGIYRVRHAEHRLTAKVTLIEGQQFPGCAKCSAAVWFELLAALADSALKPFRVTLLQIPEIEGGEAA